MLPFKSLISVDRKDKQAIHLQVANQLMQLIKRGILKSGQRIISSRELSIQLKVHRKTVIHAFDELKAQGWLETKAGSGTLVAKNLPELKPGTQKKIQEHTKLAGFSFRSNPVISQPPQKSSGQPFHLDDGFPDPRLAPLTELGRAYRNQLIHGNAYLRLGYADTRGSDVLRNQLAVYLNDTRGLNISPAHILITRGTMMSFYLTNLAFVKPGDKVVMNGLHWVSAKLNVLNAGGQILNAPVDENGLVVDELKRICQRNKVRMVYVTPHHDYPTTATLKADRRIKLLRLAAQYRFIVFEDDYDFDFHYQSRPLLPLASADQSGLVLYSGSFTKSISPAFRVGYLVATPDVIEHLAYHRRIIDRQGDVMLENSIAELLTEGIVQKYLRKSLREYRQRRDVFCDLLDQHLRREIEFQIPEGGMSVWAYFDKQIDLIKTAGHALKKGLYFSNGSQNGKLNATRLGFASSNPEELEQSVHILKKSIATNNLYPK
jgi:GntR family transcriptional regulator / MocR family aminotransferase